MANRQIFNLGENTTPVTTDVIPMQVFAGATEAEKMTITTLFEKIPSNVGILTGKLSVGVALGTERVYIVGFLNINQDSGFILDFIQIF